MSDSGGQYRVRYADLFRAIGGYLDASSFRNLTLIETPEGFVIVGHSVTTTTRGPSIERQSILFNDSDLNALAEEGYARRDAPNPTGATWPSVTVGDEHLRYEDVMRCIGELIEERRWRDVVVMQTREGFHLKGRHADTTSDESLDAAALRQLLKQSVRQRHADPPASAQPKRRFWER